MPPSRSPLTLSAPGAERHQVGRQHPVKLVVARGLLPLAIGGALWLSASATIDLARRQGVLEGTTQLAAVAMLEVVSLTGTLLWLLAPSDELRRDARLATLAASAVAGVAGWQAYGWFGLVAPIALVGTVHLASKAWREVWPAADSAVADTEQVDSTTSEPDTKPVEDGFAGPEAVELPADEPEDDEPAPLPEVKGVDPRVVAQARELLDREPLAGRPRVRSYCGVSDYAAGKLLAALRPFRAVRVGESA